MIRCAADVACTIYYLNDQVLSRLMVHYHVVATDCVAMKIVLTLIEGIKFIYRDLFVRFIRLMKKCAENSPFRGPLKLGMSNVEILLPLAMLLMVRT